MTVIAVLERAPAPAAPVAEAPANPAAPRLRRLPLPRTEPPYDDELPGIDGSRGESGAVLRLAPPTGSVDGCDRGADAAETQEMLPLAFVLPSGLPVVPAAVRVHPAFRSRWPHPADDGTDPDFDPQPTPRSALPEPRGWSGRLVQAMVEVLAGDRPSAQLVRWTTGDVYDEVRQRVRSDARGATRPVVRSLHVCEPADGVAEVCALVQRGMRSTAIALRLEGVDGRWQCTALELP